MSLSAREVAAYLKARQAEIEGAFLRRETRARLELLPRVRGTASLLALEAQRLVSEASIRDAVGDVAAALEELGAEERQGP